MVVKKYYKKTNNLLYIGNINEYIQTHYKCSHLQEILLLSKKYIHFQTPHNEKIRIQSNLFGYLISRLKIPFRICMINISRYNLILN